MNDRIKLLMEYISNSIAQFRYLNGLPDMPEGSRLVNLAQITALSRTLGILEGLPDGPAVNLDLLFAERSRCADLAEKVGIETGSNLIGQAIASRIRASNHDDLIIRLAVELRRWACDPRDADGHGECNICHRQGAGDYHGEDCPLKGIPE